MHFGEYELSPSLIGLSLLPTSHPKTFQSSENFSTFTGAVLQLVLPNLQPAHG